jgi:hypothetical protein
MKTYSVLLAITALVFASSCGSQSNPPQSSFESLTVRDNGAVAPEPVRTTATVTAGGSIRFTSEKVDAGSGDVLQTTESWTSTLSAADLEALNSLIASATVADQDDINLPNGAEGCVGASSLEISFVSQNGVENDFSIAGEVRCREDLIPSGLNAVLDKVDEFETDYAN